MTKNRKHTQPLAITTSLLLASLLSIAAGLAIALDWNHMTSPGFHKLELEHVTVPASGMMISDAHMLLFVLSWAAWLTTGILFLWNKTGHRPALASATLLGLAVTAMLLFFGPPQSFAVRSFAGPGQELSFDFDWGVLPLFSYRATADVSAHSGQTYRCVNEQRWKFAHLVIKKIVYPSLGGKNEQALLQQYCKPVPSSF